MDEEESRDEENIKDHLLKNSFHENILDEINISQNLQRSYIF